jgi:hypothetical protein
MNPRREDGIVDGYILQCGTHVPNLPKSYTLQEAHRAPAFQFIGVQTKLTIDTVYDYVVWDYCKQFCLPKQ